MWQCVNCLADVDRDFEVCWNCGTSKDGEKDPEFRRADDLPPPPPDASPVPTPVPTAEEATPEPVSVQKWGTPTCPTCGRHSLYVQQDVLAGGDGVYLLPGLGGFFSYARFDVVVCAFCGHTRFFASEQARANLPGSDWKKL